MVLALVGGALTAAQPVAAGTPDDGDPSGKVAANAIISRDIYLTGAAVTETVGLPANGPRVIKLAKGNYALRLYLSGYPEDPGDGGARNFTLADDGWYNWRCYLTGRNLAYPGINYAGNCLLRFQASGRPDIWLPVDSTSRIGFPRRTGTYYWESKIVPW